MVLPHESFADAQKAALTIHVDPPTALLRVVFFDFADQLAQFLFFDKMSKLKLSLCFKLF